MKQRRRRFRLVGPLTLALRQLKARGINPNLGQPRRLWSPDRLKAAVRLEDIAVVGLGEPENPGANRLKFFCFRHEPYEPDGTNVHSPSLYVNVEQQRWGCEVGCFDGRSGDVLDFVRTLHGLSHREGLDYLEYWAATRPLDEDT